MPHPGVGFAKSRESARRNAAGGKSEATTPLPARRPAGLAGDPGGGREPHQSGSCRRRWAFGGRLALLGAVLACSVEVCGAGGGATPLRRGSRGGRAGGGRRERSSSSRSSSPFHAPPSAASGAGWDSEGFSLPSGMQEEGYAYSGGGTGAGHAGATPTGGGRWPGEQGVARRMFGDDDDDETAEPMKLDTPTRTPTRAGGRSHSPCSW